MKKILVTQTLVILLIFLCAGQGFSGAMDAVAEAEQARKEAVALFQKGKRRGKDGAGDIKKSFTIIEAAIQKLKPYAKDNCRANAKLEDLSRTLFWAKKFTPVYVYNYNKGSKKPVLGKEKKDKEKKETPSEAEILFSYALNYHKTSSCSLEKASFLYKEIINQYPDSEFAKKAEKKHNEIQEKISRSEEKIQEQFHKAIKEYVSDMGAKLKRREYKTVCSGLNDAKRLVSNPRVKALLQKEQNKYNRMLAYKNKLISTFRESKPVQAIETGMIGIKVPGTVVDVKPNGIVIESEGKVTLPWNQVPDQAMVMLGRLACGNAILGDPDFGIIATQFGVYDVAIDVFQKTMFDEDKSTDFENWLIKATQGYKEQKSREIDTEIARARRVYNVKDQATAITMLMNLLKKYSKNQILRDKVMEISMTIKEFGQDA